MESSSLTGRQQPDTSAADVIGVGSSTTGRCDGTEAVLDIRLPVNGVESSPCGLRDGSGELAELCDRVYGNGLPISPDQQGCELPPKSSPRNDANERGGFGGKGSGAGARLRLPRSWQAGAFVLPPRWLWGYFRKFRGIGEGLFPAYPSFIVVFWSFIASFIGIALCAFLAFNTSMQRTLSPYPTSTSSSTTETGQQQQASFMIGSFGATAVLIFGTIDSPLSQPRNVVLGSAVSAVIGALIAEIFAIGGLAFPNTSWLWLQCGLAVSLSIVAMQLLRIVHPPGGASALIAVMSPPSLRCHGFFVLTPVLLGVCIMLTVALFVNNIARQYPLYWWRPVILDIPVPEGSTHHSAVTAGEAYHTIQHLHAVHSPVHHASSQLPSQQPSQPPSQLLPLCLPSSDAQRVHAVHSPVQPSVQPLVQPAVQPPVHHGMGHAAGHRNSNSSSSSSSAREHGIHVTAGEAYHTIPHIHAVHSPVHHAMPHQPLGLHSTSDAATAGGVLHRVGNTHPLPALSQHVHPQQSSAHAVQSGTDAEEDGSASRVHGGTAYIQGGRARAVTCNDAGYACTQQGTQTATAAEALAAELTFRGGPFRHVSNSAVRHVSVPPLSHQQHRDKDKQQVEQQPQPFSGSTEKFTCCVVDATSSHSSLSDDQAVDDRREHSNTTRDNKSAGIEQLSPFAVCQAGTVDQTATDAFARVDSPADTDPAAGVDAPPFLGDSIKEEPHPAKAVGDSGSSVTDSPAHTNVDSVKDSASSREQRVFGDDSLNIDGLSAAGRASREGLEDSATHDGRTQALGYQRKTC